MENLNIAAAADILTQQPKNSTTRSIIKQSFDTFVYSFYWAVNMELKVSVACWTKNWVTVRKQSGNIVLLPDKSLSS